MSSPSLRSRLAPLALLALLLVAGGAGCETPCETDTDGDGVCELDDVCAGFDDRIDSDADGVPDGCDACPALRGGDGDGDGLCDAVDPCPLDSPNDANSNDRCDVDDAFPLDGLLRVTDLALRGTHNSYHVEPPFPVDASHRYTHAPLDVQLEEQGVRVLEIDIHRSADGFEVFHLPIVDDVSTCDGFVECLEMVREWSDAHRHHLPITIWIEVKDEVGGLPIPDTAPVERVLRGVFGDDRIFTPDDLRGGAATLQDAIAGQGWPTLRKTRGQVIVALIDDDAIAERHTRGFTTLDGRTMFARVAPDQFDLPWAAIAKLGVYEGADIEAAHDAGLFVGANVCGAGESDDECFDARDAAILEGVHMMQDDFPVPVPGQAYALGPADGTPALCNEVTAPALCTQSSLE